MRKLISLLHVSLDGFVSSTCGRINWVTLDDEIFEDTLAFESGADTAIFGRNTYGMMERCWPGVLVNPESSSNELRHAAWMNLVDKIVFSHTLDHVSWKNTQVVKGDLQKTISQLKEKKGGDMMIVGSPRLTLTLMKLDLVDEYKFNINPVILGNGFSLFGPTGSELPLQLINERRFACGVVSLHYSRRRNQWWELSSPQAATQKKTA
jgi:dihydrofolate reductase